MVAIDEGIESAQGVLEGEITDSNHIGKTHAPAILHGKLRLRARYIDMFLKAVLDFA